jgi:CubicO group peptidase (beta-lactamase class C family)
MRESACFLLAAIITSVVCLPAAGVGNSEEIWPMPVWKQANPDEMGMDAGMLERAREYALTGGGSGFITRGGRVVMRWGDQERRYDLKSSTKAIGVTAVGLALKDGKFKGLNEPAKKYHPRIGVRPQSNWSYSDGGPNWLAECVTLVYGRDLNTLMFERVFGPIGIKTADLTWRSNACRAKEIDGIKRREFGSGISANVDAMARIGYLYLQRGRWQGKEIIPGRFVDMARTVPDHYGLLWWNNADGTMAKVPRDAYWSWGLYDSLIVVIPSLDIVASRAGKSLNKARNANYKSIEPFIEPIVLSVRTKNSRAVQPYPSSPIINGVAWAPAETIVRKASGSDNWPITWADDDNLYTAYGDGWGFEPKTKKKLSLGIVKIIGSPPDFKGVNIRTKSGERAGQGSKGAKASGMLCVDGVLYMLVRNVGNSQIAWSKDHGKTWRWCDWKFTVSFGCPTFLNFGRNYAGARDEFVYIYSPDSDSAYKPADRMVMARVAKDKIRKQGGYEFFKGLDGAGKPVWTKDIADRGAVFINPGRCYRSGISYNAGLKRYLWCQTIYGSEDMRFKGGLGIFDGPEPWGPWTTVYYTEQWDVGPGETSSLPTKWMSRNGKTCYLVFSGEDCFSVRKGVFQN